MDDFVRDDLFFMREALKEAQAAFDQKEVPVGAVLVHQGEIIARAHNQVEKGQDASMHAELLCLKRGAQKLGNWRLLESTLYSTLEPCSMCAGALFLFRVKRLVFAAPDLRHGAAGSFVNLFLEKHPTHQVELLSGLCAQEASELMRSFFQNRRREDG